jgi:hypothetical protein
LAREANTLTSYSSRCGTQIQSDWIEAGVGFERGADLRWQLVRLRRKPSVEGIGSPLTPAFTKKLDMLGREARVADRADRLASDHELATIAALVSRPHVDDDDAMRGA